MHHMNERLKRRRSAARKGWRTRKRLEAERKAWADRAAALLAALRECGLVEEVETCAKVVRRNRARAE